MQVRGSFFCFRGRENPAGSHGNPALGRKAMEAPCAGLGRGIENFDGAFQNRKTVPKISTGLFKTEKHFRATRRDFSKQKNAFAPRDGTFLNRKMLSRRATGLF